MKKNNNITELKKVRKNIDEIDSKIIKLISDRFKEIHKVTKLKDSHDQIIDHERITHILKSVQSKAKKIRSIMRLSQGYGKYLFKKLLN